MDETDPLGIFLVKSGSKGDRLLFRYPFRNEDEGVVSEKCSKKSPYALVGERKDDLSTPKEVKCKESDEAGLFNFDDKVLSNLFAVKTELCGHQFELKIENIRFVGHPTYLPHASSREQSTLTMFHVVFALRAKASHSIVNSYHDLSHRVSIAIHHEERRCGYLTSQVKLMQAAHDEVATLPEDCEESPFNLVLRRSQLAVHLRILYEDLKNTGIVHLRIHDWIETSFCLPAKVHRLHDERLNIGPESIQTCLNALRPYHGLLLIVDVNELMATLPEDTLPALCRFIQVLSPLKNLQQLAADADIILSYVFQLVGHLVYWCKAVVIYPLCDSNVYTVSPHAPTSLSSILVDIFAERFPGMNLLVVMSQFSTPTSLSQLSDPMNMMYQQAQLVQMVSWMLQHRLLIQIHTYVSLLPADESLLLNLNNQHREEQSRRVTNGSHLQSFHSEDSLVSSSLSDNHSKSSSEEDLSLREQDYIHLSELTPVERNSILQESTAGNSDDLKNFLRLSPYFKGKHHLEEIMYCENIRRSQLLALLDKFHRILITYQYEDAAVSAFYNYI